jgi:hypothetical protein
VYPCEHNTVPPPYSCQQQHLQLCNIKPLTLIKSVNIRSVLTRPMSDAKSDVIHLQILALTGYCQTILNAFVVFSKSLR